MSIIPVYSKIEKNQIFFISDNIEMCGPFNNWNEFRGHMERFVDLYLREKGIVGMLRIFVLQKIVEYALDHSFTPPFDIRKT